MKNLLLCCLAFSFLPAFAEEATQQNQLPDGVWDRSTWDQCKWAQEEPKADAKETQPAQYDKSNYDGSVYE